MQHQKEERQQEKKADVKREKGMMKYNQKQRHQVTKNTEATRTTKRKQKNNKRRKYLLHKTNAIIRKFRKGPVVKKGKGKKNEIIFLVFL